MIARDGEVVATFAAESPPGALARQLDPTPMVAGGGFCAPTVWCCPEFGGRRLAELTDAERASRDDHWTRLGRVIRAYLAEADG